MKKLQDYNRNLQFPIKASWKLDGIFAKTHNGRLYSRNDKLFPIFDHIAKDLENGIEGELYNHNLTFEQICSGVKRKTPNNLTSLIKFIPHKDIESFYIHSQNELDKILHKAVNELGYKGLVIEIDNIKYKYKPFFDEEYIITGYKEGKGKLTNKVGYLIFDDWKASLTRTHEYL